MSTRSMDVVVVGTGIGGLSAAKTYRELQPMANLVLLEKQGTLGGVWAAEKDYEGLKTNNLHGTYEWPDFPMDDKYNVKTGSHIPGVAMHKYMNAFAHHFDLYSRIRFQTRVVEVEKLETGEWKVTTEKIEEEQAALTEIYVCKKLIIATGLASSPSPVRLQGQEAFGKPVMNQGKLTTEGQRIAQDPNIKSVAVIGASKSGYDAVHLFASHGKRVDWIIRESGGGATYMFPSIVPLMVTGKPTMLEHTATMRIFTWFSPCVWGVYDGFGWIRRFLHGTWLGRNLTHRFWENMRWGSVAGNGYRENEALKHLEPDEGLFWTARVGVHNYPTEDGTIHEYLRSGQVKITKKDVSHLSKDGTVVFADGSNFQTGCLVQTTGWSLIPEIKYSPPGIEVKLGLPHVPKDEAEVQLWDGLNRESEKSILKQFPYLSKPPSIISPYKQITTPWRLYRGIAPPGLTIEGDRSIVFMKFVHSTSNFIIAETQALWSYAYLNGQLDIKSESVYPETSMMSAYGKVRYPCGFSQWFPEFIWDVIPYADMLLSDLGVRKWRKSTWKDEVFSGYVVQDYKGINKEWKQQHSSDIQTA